MKKKKYITKIENKFVKFKDLKYPKFFFCLKKKRAVAICNPRDKKLLIKLPKRKKIAKIPKSEGDKNLVNMGSVNIAITAVTIFTNKYLEVCLYI